MLDPRFDHVSAALVALAASANALRSRSVPDSATAMAALVIGARLAFAAKEGEEEFLDAARAAWRMVSVGEPPA